MLLSTITKLFSEDIMHLTLEERYYIDIESKKGTSHNEIAKALCRSQSVISRELSRNVGFWGYRYKQAQSKAARRNERQAKSDQINHGGKHKN